MPFLNMVELGRPGYFTQEPLSQYVVKYSFIPAHPTFALELHISMCQRAAQDLALQFGLEYAFGNNQEPRATQLNLLSSEEMAGLS